MHNRRAALQFAAALAACGPLSRVGAQTFPQRALTMIMPYAAGGTGDMTARLLADAMGKILGQSVIVDNRPGGGGAIGTAHVLSAKPDGYTLLFVAPGVFSVMPRLVKVGYSLESFRSIGIVSATPQLLVARKGAKLSKLADFVSAARATPASIAVGYGGIGTPNHFALVNLELTANIKLNGVAYKGSAPMLQDLLGGQLELGVDQVSSSKQYIESGSLTPVAVFGPPVSWLSGVPSLSSIAPEALDVTSYLAVMVSRETPHSIFQTIQVALEKAVRDPALRAALEKVGSSPYFREGQEFDSIVRKEYVFVQKLVDSGALRPS